MISTLGRTMVGLGIAIAVLGVIVWLIGTMLPVDRGGRLPGDIVIERPGFTLYAPFGLMIAVSVIGTLVLWLLSILSRR